MKIEATAYEVMCTDDPYTYEVCRALNQNGHTRWVVYRRLSTKPNRPPYKEVFTSEGWEKMLIKKGHVELFGSLEEVIAA